MKSFVITILENEQSMQVATRCIQSGQKHGLEIKHFDAITPQRNNPIQIAKDKGIPLDGFKEVYSRFENCLSAFLSHHTLWEYCVRDNTEYTIFEHDAVVVDKVPEYIAYHKVISLGKPSYGKFRNPSILGVNPLTSKPYFPGAHAYRINPKGAQELIERAKKDGGPTDVFLSLNKFIWLQEYYPWPVEARDSFTTIQKTEGCLAKHSYGETYEII
tara:strand:- start:27150 stop:27797 length:648 start_codon:yes stop_codon:yes gene_type:complete